MIMIFRMIKNIVTVYIIFIRFYSFLFLYLYF